MQFEPGRSRKAGDDLDLADDGGVEIRQLLGGNPIFEMASPAGLANLIAIEEGAAHPEARDDSPCRWPARSSRGRS